MKKFFLSAFVILTFIIYTIHQRFGQFEESGIVTPVKKIETGSANTSSQKLSQPVQPSSSAQKNRGTTQPTSFPSNTYTQLLGKYKNGEYTGDVVDAYYGNVQVKAVISGGKITDVVFLDYPQDRRTSIRINSQAMPYLTQEAIQAQSANVDIVSGATQTSRAFRESLQSALDRAKV